MLVELSRPSPTLPEILSGIGSSVVGAERTLKELLQDLAFSKGVQARMDGILFQGLEEASYDNPILTLIKDYLGSLWPYISTFILISPHSLNLPYSWSLPCFYKWSGDWRIAGPFIKYWFTDSCKLGSSNSSLFWWFGSADVLRETNDFQRYKEPISVGLAVRRSAVSFAFSPQGQM